MPGEQSILSYSRGNVVLQDNRSGGRSITGITVVGQSLAPARLGRCAFNLFFSLKVLRDVGLSIE